MRIRILSRNSSRPKNFKKFIQEDTFQASIKPNNVNAMSITISPVVGNETVNKKDGGEDLAGAQTPVFLAALL